MRRASLRLAGITGIVLAVVVWWEFRDGGPGPLSPMHAAVAELAGVESCDRCHRGEGGKLTGCMACHEHRRTEMDKEHRKVGEDRYETAAASAARADAEPPPGSAGPGPLHDRQSGALHVATTYGLSRGLRRNLPRFA